MKSLGRSMHACCERVIQSLVWQAFCDFRETGRFEELSTSSPASTDTVAEMFRVRDVVELLIAEVFELS